VRIPWGLLNVTDPSSHQVVHETIRDDGIVETTTTEGFRFHVLALTATVGKSRVIDSPPDATRTPADYPRFTWPAWEAPAYRLGPKRSYTILRATFRSLP